MRRRLVIGLGSTQQVGKDTLFSALHAVEPQCIRFSFADELRKDLAPLVQTQWGIDIWRMTPEQKDLVRPIMIAYGMAWRKRDPDHWVKKVIAGVRSSPLMSVPVVTDVRFVNEAKLMRHEFPEAFQLVNLTRDGAPPPTEEEEKHWRDVAAQANIHFHWGNDKEVEREIKAEELLRRLGAWS